jgi:hypothetical protein
VVEVKVILGTKLSEQEQQSVDMTKAVRLTAQPPAGSGVVGQDDSCQYIVCPYCGCVGCLPTHWHTTIHTFICHCCGFASRVL